MGFSEYSTIINTVVGVIGIIVGVIGWKSLSVAKKITNKINNKVGNVENSTIQQAQTMTINNGLDTYAIVKLSTETTKEELKEVLKRIDKYEKTLNDTKQELEKKPNIYYGKQVPQELKEGDIFFMYED